MSDDEELTLVPPKSSPTRRFAAILSVLPGSRLWKNSKAQDPSITQPRCAYVLTHETKDSEPVFELTLAYDSALSNRERFNLEKMKSSIATVLKKQTVGSTAWGKTPDEEELHTVSVWAGYALSEYFQMIGASDVEVKEVQSWVINSATRGNPDVTKQTFNVEPGWRGTEGVLSDTYRLLGT